MDLSHSYWMFGPSSSDEYDIRRASRHLYSLPGCIGWPTRQGYGWMDIRGTPRKISGRVMDWHKCIMGRLVVMVILHRMANGFLFFCGLHNNLSGIDEAEFGFIVVLTCRTQHTHPNPPILS